MESHARKLTAPLLGAALALALALSACGGTSGSAKPGEDGGACFAGGVCNAGLVCQSGTCRAPSGGDTAGTPDGDVSSPDGDTVGTPDGDASGPDVVDPDVTGADGDATGPDGGDPDTGDASKPDADGGDTSKPDADAGDTGKPDVTGPDAGDGGPGDGGPGDGGPGDGGPGDTTADGSDAGPTPVVTETDCTGLAECLADFPDVSSCQTLACDTTLGKCTLTAVPNGKPCDSGDACLVGTICLAGECSGGKALVCEDDNACTDDACDTHLGCTFTANTAPCTDGNACTDDQCSGGACVSVSVPGACDCFDGIDCIPLDDGNPCNGVLVCETGECVVAPTSIVTCSTSGDSDCTKTSCSPVSGLCEKANLSGPVCDDGDPCTVDDACLTGQCAGVDGQVCGCQTNADCGVLEDGNLCNGVLHCVNNQCVVNPETVKTCAGADPSTCEQIGCVPLTGLCGPVPKGDGLACDDNDPCTESTTCAAGACGGGVGPDCDDGDPCTIDSCDELGGCVNGATPGPCDDEDACTKNDTCASGTCAGVPVVCDDGNPCTDDSCNPLTGCSFKFNTIVCDDNSPCTENDACALGVCTGKLKSCNDGNPCTIDLCNETGGCTALPTDGTTCNDQNACTINDKCIAGECSGLAKNCDDASPCTLDACAPATGCVYTPQEADCNDQNACTFNDVCVEGGCAGTPLACDDDNACTFDSCNPLSGCKNELLTGACDDGDPCTEQTTCQSGVCIGVPVYCDDGNACTADFCDPEEGCTTTLLTGACNDNNACTVGDVCSQGQCKGVAKNCLDSDPCTVDGCVLSTGLCEHIPAACPCTINLDCNTSNACKAGTCVEEKCVITDLTTPCNDGNSCSINDICDAGVCAGQVLDCDDENSCTLDSCVQGVGCVNTPREGGCTDADACTFSDVCVEGECVGQALTCNDNNPCTDDLCDQDFGCEFPNNSIDCNDNDACTLNDTCTLGACKGVPSTAPECGPPPEPCTFNWKLFCNESHNGTLSGGQAQISTWPAACFGDGTGTYSGPEFVYKVTATCTGGATATVTRAGGVQGFMDVGIMASKDGFCSTDQCLGGAKMVGNQAKAFFQVEEGKDYFVAVDGRNGALGDFSFSFQCDCEPVEGGTCVVGETLSCNTPKKGDTALGTNGVSSWKSCIGLNDYAAPELAYEFVAPCDGQQVFTLTRDPGETGSFDLFILDGPKDQCGPEACTEGALMLDGKAALSVATVAGEKLTILVDGFSGAIGKFTLTPTCNCGAFETDCTNQEDDDSDGDTDCEDSDCVLHPNCKPPAGVCQANLAIACNQKAVGTNAAGLSNVAGWENCAVGSDYSAPENVYAFKPPCAGDVTVRIDRQAGLTGKLSAIVMDESIADTCGPAGCVTSTLLGADASITQFTADANQDYFIAVDGLDGATGPYELRVDCGCVPKETECFGDVDDDGDGQTDCDDTDCADVVPCVVGDLCTPTETAECNQTVVGNTANGTANVDVWNGCSVEGSNYAGKEQVWSFTPSCSGGTKIKLTNDASFQFVDLIVLDGQADVCTNVECVTATFGGDAPNELVFNGIAGHQYYLVVDGGPADTNGYQLEIDCTCVPFETDCGNLFDDDGDGDIDCVDLDCDGSPFCTLSESTCDEVLNCVNQCAGSGSCIQGCTTGANEQVLALYEALLGCIIAECAEAPGEELQACIQALCTVELEMCTEN